MKKNILWLLGLMNLTYATFDINGLPWIQAQNGDELELIGHLLPADPVILEAGTCDGNDTIAMKKDGRAR